MGHTAKVAARMAGCEFHLVAWALASTGRGGSYCGSCKKPERSPAFRDDTDADSDEQCQFHPDCDDSGNTGHGAGRRVDGLCPKR